MNACVCMCAPPLRSCVCFFQCTHSLRSCVACACISLLISAYFFLLLLGVNGNLRGITTVGLGADGSMQQPQGPPAPADTATPSPYQTYSPSWGSTNIQMNWTPVPNANVFATNNIAKLTLDLMGPNFQIIRTAVPSR